MSRTKIYVFETPQEVKEMAEICRLDYGADVLRTIPYSNGVAEVHLLDRTRHVFLTADRYITWRVGRKYDDGVHTYERREIE